LPPLVTEPAGKSALEERRRPAATSMASQGSNHSSNSEHKFLFRFYI
jgi:hypothetical protein